MSEAQIKPATVEHLPAIRDLAAVIWHAYYPGIVSREQIDYMLGQMYAIDTLRDEMQNQGIRFERMLVEDELVGFAAYGPLANPGCWKLHKLYLLPRLHGKGFGTRLLNHCEIQAQSLGAQRLQLNVNKRNTRALSAYQRNGYTLHESVTNEIGNGFRMDDFVMVKKLT